MKKTEEVEVSNKKSKSGHVNPPRDWETVGTLINNSGVYGKEPMADEMTALTHYIVTAGVIPGTRFLDRQSVTWYPNDIQYSFL